MIPKLLHVIWVGDEARRPDRLIQTWVDAHPDWEVKLWGNQDLGTRSWRTRRALYELGQRDCAGVAATMRWEILLDEGGVAVAADSLCLRQLDDVLRDCSMFASWVNELAEPGVVSDAYVGCEPGHPLVARIVDDIVADGKLATKSVSQAVGAWRLTQAWRDARYSSLTILPSHSFQPRHPQAPGYRGGGTVYALELYASRLGLLDTLCTLDPHALREHYLASSGPEGGGSGGPGGLRAPAAAQAPLFSVVIPAYNRRDLLGEALASAFAQPGDDIEILVVDDGSTDGTAEALAELTARGDDPRLRVLRQSNAGTAAARNRGVQEARGTWLVWLDSDDMLMPGTLAAYRERLAATPDNPPHTPPDVLYGDLLVLDAEGGQHGRWAYAADDGEPVFPKLLAANRYPNPGTAVRRSLYERVGAYDGELPASEDYDFWLRAAAAGARFEHIGRDVCIYRRASTSRSADLARSQVADAQLVSKALRQQPWSVLFPQLDWSRPDLARTQGMLLAAQVLLARAAWREVAEYAAGLQLNAAALAGIDAGSVEPPATGAAVAPAAAAAIEPAPAAPAADDPRAAHRARRVADVQEQFRRLAAQPEPRFALDWRDRWLCLDDDTPSTGFDRHYTYHPAWAARILAQTRPDKHIDISSSLQFVTQVSAFVPTEFYDVRPVDMGLPGLACGRADLTRLPFADGSVRSISCMHVVEHVGLGRYGDALDYDGDLKAVAELKRVTAEGGQILFVVPIGGRARIQFNAHRIYTHAQVLQMFDGWDLKEFALIPDQPGEGGLIVGARAEQADRQHYGCGCFWFVRRTRAASGLKPDAVPLLTVPPLRVVA